MKTLTGGAKPPTADCLSTQRTAAVKADEIEVYMVIVYVVIHRYSFLVAGKTLPEAICFTAGSSFLANRPMCDKTADRRQIKSIPVLRAYVWHE